MQRTGICRHGIDKTATICGECQKHAEYMRRYYHRNPEPVKERSRRDYFERLAKDPKLSRLKALTRVRRYQAKQKLLGNWPPSRPPEYYRAWRAAHPERDKAIAKRYRQSHLDVGRAKAARRSERVRGALGSHTDAQWIAIQRRQNFRCAMCFETKTLTKDHIVPLVAGGTHFAYNIQGLCASCNSKKGVKLIAPA